MEERQEKRVSLWPAAWNRFLEVDLDTGKTGIRRIDPGDLRAFVGGAGPWPPDFFFDTRGPEVDPLSPENPLLIMAGPMVGTTFPGTSRFVLCARSPLTGIWGESSAGGFFGADLKKAGLDGILHYGPG